MVLAGRFHQKGIDRESGMVYHMHLCAYVHQCLGLNDAPANQSLQGPLR